MAGCSIMNTIVSEISRMCSVEINEGLNELHWEVMVKEQSCNMMYADSGSALAKIQTEAKQWNVKLTRLGRSAG